MNEQAKATIQYAAEMCETAMIFEFHAVQRGDYESAAVWSESAVTDSQVAFDISVAHVGQHS